MSNRNLLDGLRGRRVVLNMVSFLVSFMLTGVVLLGGCANDPGGTTGLDATVLSSEQPPDFSFDPADVVSADDAGGVETGGRPIPRSTGGGRSTSGGTTVTQIENWDEEKEFEAGVEGTMSLGDDMELWVGSTALGDDVSITAEVWQKTVDGVVEWIQYEFGPTMTFLDAIELRVEESLITSTASASGKYTLWYEDQRTGKWTFEDDGKVVDSRVVFEIEHFSKYAIGN